jgi:DNA ligase 4
MPPPSPSLTNIPDTDEERLYEKPIPINTGRYPPFGALSGLYEKLSNESKHELRRKLLAKWFTVCVGCSVRLLADYYL